MSARQGSPACAHLGADQRAGRLGGDQQPEPAGMLGGGDAALLVGVHLDQGLEGAGPAAAGGAAAVSKRAAWPCPGGSAVRGGGSGGTGAPVSRAQAAASERGSPQRPAWPSSSASVSSTSWQRLDPHAGAQQGG